MTAELTLGERRGSAVHAGRGAAAGGISALADLDFERRGCDVVCALGRCADTGGTSALNDGSGEKRGSKR